MPKMSKTTLLSSYSLADIEEILNVSREEARRLKTDPESKLSLAQFKLLNPELHLIPRPLYLRRRRQRRQPSKYLLPQKTSNLAVEILTPPDTYRSSRFIRIFYGKKSSKEIMTDTFTDDGVTIFKDLFTIAEYRKSPFSDKIREAQRREESRFAMEMQSELRKVFGDEYEEFKNLFTKTTPDLNIPVRRNILRYYQLHNSNEGREAFRNDPYYSIFAGFKVVKTVNPFLRPKVFDFLNLGNDIKVSDDNSLIVSTNNGLQVMATGKITNGEIEFAYPADPADEQEKHIFWATPYIDVPIAPVKQAPKLRVFLTPGLTLTVLQQERKSVVLLNNGRFFYARITQKELDDLIKAPMSIRKKYPDFSQYPASILWKR